MTLDSTPARAWTLLGATMIAAFAAGCGDSGSSDNGEGGAGNGGDGPGAECPSGTLCLDVVETGDPAPGRLVIVWFRLEGSIGYDPTIGLDLPFDAAAGSLEIDLASVTLPPDIDLHCVRSCEEPAECPCPEGAFRAGVAYVLIVTDADQSGAIDVVEIADPALYVGIANTAVVWSDAATALAPPPFDVMFPEGVDAGIAPYRVLENSAFVPTEAGLRFDLRAGTEAIAR